MSVALNPASTKSLYLYGEPASHTFSGGKAVVYFTDGTSMTVVIPASSLTPSLTTTTKSFTGLTVTSPNGGSYDSTGQLNVQWTSYVGDFDYYQIMLGNNIANSEVEMGDGMQISKYQNSYNTFAISSFVDKIISNSGMSRDVIKDAYYVKVNAVKLDRDRVSGGIMNTGKSNIFSIRSLDVYYSVKSPLINYVTVSQNGGAVSQLQLGNTYSIKWNETNTSGNTQVTLQQMGNTWNTVMIISTLNSVGNGTNSTSFTMPTSFSPVSGATYKIWVQSGNVGGEQMVSFANTSVRTSYL
ncbi:MAG: hypothetical protein NTV72_03785 [Candidatus Taylorbacteria bacterium]|nr:hypothetical protein [Candidatus Taylorbacteria bacterium]